MLFDLTSSYFEGSPVRWPERLHAATASADPAGHYGLMTMRRLPGSVSVFAGNTAIPDAALQVEKARRRSASTAGVVGDRG